MPRVSQDHLDARRAQVVDAARRCFARQGFQATTMKDVLAESGLSAGAVYSYVRSKEELVGLVASSVFTDAAPRLQAVLFADPVPAPAEAVAGVIAAVDPLGEPEGVLRLAVQVWGEALRNEAIGEAVGALYRELRSWFVRYAERAVEAGHLAPGTDAETAGRTYFGMVPGYIIQRLLLGDVDPESYAAGLRAVLSARNA
jgi:AcrR family transcriptional regulator